jgi:hypothetical protein
MVVKTCYNKGGRAEYLAVGWRVGEGFGRLVAGSM